MSEPTEPAPAGGSAPPVALAPPLPTPLVQNVQHNTAIGFDMADAAARLAEAEPVRMVAFMERVDAQQFELAKLQIDVAQKDRADDRAEAEARRKSNERVLSLVLVSVMMIAAMVLAYAAWTGDRTVVQVVITAVVSGGGGGMIGRATAPKSTPAP